MTTDNSNIKKENHTPILPSTSYFGLPEGYMVMPENGNIDIDALHCTLERARAVCLMLGKNFDESGDKLNDEIIYSACWALEGMINQAQILTKGQA